MKTKTRIFVNKFICKKIQNMDFQKYILKLLYWNNISKILLNKIIK